MNSFFLISEFSNYESTIKFNFGSLHYFKSYTLNVRGVPSIVATFEISNFTFEIFCQSVPVQNQYAVIHLNIEARLLRLSGNVAKENIRNLKRQGIKTEPAFALYFKILGDPYDELAKMASYTDQQLQNIIDKCLENGGAVTKRPYLFYFSQAKQSKTHK